MEKQIFSQDSSAFKPAIISKGILLVPIQLLPTGAYATKKCVLYGLKKQAYNTDKS